MDMSPERWHATCDYMVSVFGPEAEPVRTLMPRAVTAGLPDIAVSGDVGRLLIVLTSMTGGGRGGRRALEGGTLGGCWEGWAARGLAPGGRLITIESEARHADFAGQEFRAAGVGASVEIRRGAALQLLPAVAAAAGPDGLDFVFLDA